MFNNLLRHSNCLLVVDRFWQERLADVTSIVIISEDPYGAVYVHWSGESEQAVMDLIQGASEEYQAAYEYMIQEEMGGTSCQDS